MIFLCTRGKIHLQDSSFFIGSCTIKCYHKYAFARYPHKYTFPRYWTLCALFILQRTKLWNFSVNYLLYFITHVPLSLITCVLLYLPDKPEPEDLQYFLEFQVPNQWAPMFNELALGPQRRKVSCPKLQFRFFGPKLQVNIDQVYLWS